MALHHVHCHAQPLTPRASILPLGEQQSKGWAVSTQLGSQWCAALCCPSVTAAGQQALRLVLSTPQVARTVGWIAQWKEMMEEASGRISRPRQVSTSALRDAHSAGSPVAPCWTPKSGSYFSGRPLPVLMTPPLHPSCAEPGGLAWLLLYLSGCRIWGTDSAKLAEAGPCPEPPAPAMQAPLWLAQCS